jgi:hypothetical protein
MRLRNTGRIFLFVSSNIKMDLGETGREDADRDKWRAPANTTVNIQAPQKARNLLTR